MMRAARPLLSLAAIAFALALVRSPSMAADTGDTPRIELPSGDSGMARSVTVGLNKSLLIELPGNVREVVISNPAVVEASQVMTRTLEWLLAPEPTRS